MSLEEIDITCPHCRRPYRLKVDLGVLARVRKQAVCFRCQTTFDVLSRIAARSGHEKSSRTSHVKSSRARAVDSSRTRTEDGSRAGTEDIQAEDGSRSRGEDSSRGVPTRDIKVRPPPPPGARATSAGVGAKRLPALVKRKSVREAGTGTPESDARERVTPLHFELPAMPESSWLDQAEPDLDELWAKTEASSQSLGALLADAAE